MRPVRCTPINQLAKNLFNLHPLSPFRLQAWGTPVEVVMQVLVEKQILMFLQTPSMVT